TRARLELLHAPAIDLGDVEITVGVDAQTMHAPHAAGEVAPRAPCVLEVAFAIPFDHLRRTPVRAPDVARAIHDDQVQIRRRLPDAPHPHEFTVLVEHLDAAVVAVVDVDEMLDGIDGNAVHAVEVPGTRFRLLGRPFALLAPRGHVIVVLVVLDDA